MLKPRKAGWLDKGRKDLSEDRGGVSKIPQKRWNRKEGRGHKDVKRGGGQVGQGVGALKRGRARTPL